VNAVIGVVPSAGWKQMGGAVGMADWKKLAIIHLLAGVGLLNAYYAMFGETLVVRPLNFLASYLCLTLTLFTIKWEMEVS